MLVSIHQPNYLPYLGFFHKVAQSDVFVSYDNAQFSKNDFHNRNKVKTTHGWTWLTVPVRKPLKRQLRHIEIDVSKNWRKEHMMTLRSCYSRAPYFGNHLSYFEQLYSQGWDRLTSLNEEILTHFFEILCPEVEFKRASDLAISEDLDPTEKIVCIVKAVGGTSYLSGPFGRQYMDESKFIDVELKYQTFKHPTYSQLFGEFIPNLSFVDALFNVGSKALADMLKTC